MDNKPHIGLIKLSYSIHEYLQDGMTSPEAVEKTNEDLIIGIVGQDKNICIRKIREIIQGLKDESVRKS